MLSQQIGLDACLNILYTNPKFKEYFPNNIGREMHNRFRHSLRLVFLNDLTSSRKSKADTLMNVTNIPKETCYPLISTLESLMNSFQQLEKWKKHKIKTIKILASFNFATCDKCGEISNSIVTTKNAQIGVNLPPFHIDCRCIAIAFFERTGISGTIEVNDPISNETFEMNASASYVDWIKLLEKKYGKGAIEFQKELVKNKIYTYSTHTFVEFYKKFNGDKLPYTSFTSHQLKVLSKESFFDNRENAIELLEISAEKETYYPFKAKSYRVIGEYYLDIENKEKALHFFERALNFDPKVGVRRIYNKLKKETLSTLDDSET